MPQTEANPAPICAHGPSLPAEPPLASVMIVATSLTGMTLKSILPILWWTASITFSVPWPAASGAKYLTIKLLARIAIGREYWYGRWAPEYSRPAAYNFKNRAVPPPDNRPTIDANTVHLMMRQKLWVVLINGFSSRVNAYFITTNSSWRFFDQSASSLPCMAGFSLP